MRNDQDTEAPFDPNEIPDSFWSVIAQADHSSERLRSILDGQTPEQVFAFARNFLEAATQLKDEPFLQYVSPDESEDGVEDIANWVVSQGKDFYARVWHNPERMPKSVEVGDPAILYGVAEKLYRQKYGKMPDLY